MPSDPNVTIRARIAFIFLAIFIIALSAGAYFIADLAKSRDSIAARETQPASPGVTAPKPIEEALRQNPSNKFLQLAAMAARAAEETNAAAEKLSNEVEPPAIAKATNLGAATRSDLEALRRDLKTAEANATAAPPRYIVLLKTERDKVESYALSLGMEKAAVSSFLGNVDKRHAEIAAFTSGMSSARADYYRAYQGYVGVLIEQFGVYKVVGGQFIFPSQPIVDRYNVAARAMSVAAKRVAGLEEERKRLSTAQQEGWDKLVKK